MMARCPQKCEDFYSYDVMQKNFADVRAYHQKTLDKEEYSKRSLSDSLVIILARLA